MRSGDEQRERSGNEEEDEGGEFFFNRNYKSHNGRISKYN